MKFLVINGSPKGENSITLQTVRYLEHCFPAHSFSVLHAGQRIKALEKDFTPALQALEAADVLLFSYPVYTFLAPCQLHRFLELVKESGICLAGKLATQITTSKHFYDITAHRYIQENCQDLGLGYIRGLSADMDDLLSEKGRREARDFFCRFLWCAEKGFLESPVPFAPATDVLTATPAADPAGSKPGNVVIVADLQQDDAGLAAMIARFQAKLPYATRVVNIRQYPFRGGCLGCFHCAGDGSCIYSDGFDRFLREQIQTAQAIVYAFTISDHSMGARFKLYDDRQFCNGHRTVTIGMPVGYLVNGCLSREENLRTVMEARGQVGCNPISGIATSEQDPDAAIDRLAESLAYDLEHQYTQPQNFYGIGGMKIFRDLIYQMQGLMRADHKFFKAQGQYDFPQKKKGTIAMMYLVGAMMNSKTIRAKAGSKMTDGMLAPYRKVLSELKQKGEI